MTIQRTDIELRVKDAFTAALARFQQSVGSAEKSTAALGRAGQTAGKQVSDGMQTAGRATGGLDASALALTKRMAALGAAIAAALAGGRAVGGAVSLDASLQRLQALTQGTTTDMDRLRDAIKIASNVSQEGLGAAAAAAEFLAREGLNAAEAAQALAAGAAVARAQAVPLTQVLDQVNTTLGAYGLGADKFVVTSERVAAVARESGAGIDDIFTALNRAAAGAAQAGVSLESLILAIGALASKSIEGGRAAAALRPIFAEIADPASKLRLELEAVGVTIGSFDGLVKAAAESPRVLAAALESLGSASGVAFQALVEQAEGGGLERLRETMEASAGATATLASTLNNDLPGALASIGNEATVQLQATLQPFLVDATKSAIELREALALAASDPRVQASVAALVDQLGRLAGALTGMSSDVATTEQQLQGLADGIESVTLLMQGLEPIVRQAAGSIGLLFDGLNVSIRTAQALALSAMEQVNRAFAQLLDLGATDIGSALIRRLTGVEVTAENAAAAIAAANARALEFGAGASRAFDAAAIAAGAVNQRLANLAQGLGPVTDATNAAAGAMGNLAAASEPAAAGLAQVDSAARSMVQPLQELPEVLELTWRESDQVAEKTEQAAQGVERVGESASRAAPALQQASAATADAGRTMGRTAQQASSFAQGLGDLIESIRNVSPAMRELTNSALQGERSLGSFARVFSALTEQRERGQTAILREITSLQQLSREYDSQSREVLKLQRQFLGASLEEAELLARLRAEQRAANAERAEAYRQEREAALARMKDAERLVLVEQERLLIEQQRRVEVEATARVAAGGVVRVRFEVGDEREDADDNAALVRKLIPELERQLARRTVRPRIGSG